MEQYTVEQFIEDVRKEAQALRDNATKEELASLDFIDLHPKYPSMCIYGQMTGDCRNLRASELIFSCCQRFVVNDFDENSSIEKTAKHMNGSAISGVSSPIELKRHRSYSLVHLSAIEAYIMTPEAKNANLISYLKGEIDTLEL